MTNENKKTDKSKHSIYYWLIILAVVVVIIGAIWYIGFREPVEVEEASEEIVVQSDEVDTSDRLTYENEEYGFSFKYPGDWSFLTDPMYNSVHFYSPGSEKPEILENRGYEPGFEGDVWFIIHDNSNEMTIEEFFDGVNAPNPLESATDVSNIERNNIKGKKYIGVENGSTPIKYTVAIIMLNDIFIEINDPHEKQEKHGMFDTFVYSLKK